MEDLRDFRSTFIKEESALCHAIVRRICCSSGIKTLPAESSRARPQSHTYGGREWRPARGLLAHDHFELWLATRFATVLAISAMLIASSEPVLYGWQATPRNRIVQSHTARSAM